MRTLTSLSVVLSSALAMTAPAAAQDGGVLHLRGESGGEQLAGGGDEREAGS